MAKGKKRLLKVCPNCGSTSVRPVKELDEWTSVEEQMDSSGSDKFECDECGYKGELIKVAEAPEEDELEESVEEEVEKPVVLEKPKKPSKAPKIAKKKKR